MSTCATSRVWTLQGEDIPRGKETISKEAVGKSKAKPENNNAQVIRRMLLQGKSPDFKYSLTLAVKLWTNQLTSLINRFLIYKTERKSHALGWVTVRIKEKYVKASSM